MILKNKAYRRTAQIVYDLYKGRKFKHALDIGSKIPIALIELRSLGLAQDLTPVEILKLGSGNEVNFCEKTLDRVTLIDDNYVSNSEYFDEYKRIKTDNWLYNQCIKYLLAYKYSPPSLTDFEQAMNTMYFGKSVDQFLSLDSRKYDLIIISKLLTHYKSSRVEMVKRLLQKLNYRGIMFLRLNREGYDTLNTLDEAEISEIKRTLVIMEEYIEQIQKSHTNQIIIGQNKL